MGKNNSLEIGVQIDVIFNSITYLEIPRCRGRLRIRIRIRILLNLIRPSAYSKALPEEL